MPSSPQAPLPCAVSLCRYFGRPGHRNRMELVNDTGAVWSPLLVVRQEVAQVRPASTVHSSVPTHSARTSPQMENPAGRIVMRYRVDKVKELVRYLAPACTHSSLAGQQTHAPRRGAYQVLEPTYPAMNSTPMDAEGAGKVTSRACDLTLPACCSCATHIRMCTCTCTCICT
jgi:hypothetical protein